MEDDSNPTASSSRDKRASETPDEQATISKKFMKDQLGAICISCPDLDDVGCSGFGRNENGLIGDLSGYLRMISHSECSNMAKLKEELHTHGSRCVFITENVRDVERRIIENIQRDKCGQYVSLTAKQPYTKKHELTLRIGQSYATSNSTQIAESIEVAAVDGLDRWASGIDTFETARTAKGFNLSEI